MYERKAKKGIIHLHSENSLMDSAQSVNDIVKRAYELECPAITLTDHGTLTGIEDFMTAIDEFNAMNKTNIKGIPGVEAYYAEEDDVTRRRHLVLLSKDIQGYRAISKAVSMSNANIDSKGMPIMNPEIIEKMFAEGSEGHGHVIATSACMIGVVASKLLKNLFVEREITSLEKKLKGLYDPNSKAYVKNKARVDEIENEIKSISEEVKELDKLAKKPFKKKENALKTYTGAEYDEALAALNAEKEGSKNAGIKSEELKDLRKKLKAEEKRLKDQNKIEEKDHEKWNLYSQKIDDFKTKLEAEDVLLEEAKNEAIKFEKIFGKGNFYLEVQNHRIEEEMRVMPIIAKIAKELNIPVVAANDAHMTRKTAEDAKARQIMRSLRYNKWETAQESDNELYIKDDYELSEILKEILPDEVVNEAMNNIGVICDACNVDFVKVNHYPKFKSPNGESSAEYLRKLVYSGIEWRYPNKEGWTDNHAERIEYELSVIEKLDVCDYLCIVEDFLRYGRLLGKMDMNNPDPRYLADPYNIDLLAEIVKDDVGLGIGPGRGSAVGSLVSYLIGITGIDPIKYNLIFERFLNVERVSMPDIDSDFKPDIRNKVLDYVKYTYGEEAVCCIMTKGRQKAKAAIRNCARLLGSELHDDTRHFLDLGDMIAKTVPNTIGVSLDDCWDLLIDKFGSNKFAMQILNNAKLVEGTFTNIGMHAAGVIIADNGDVKEYLPLMYNKKKEQWTTQCDMVQSEARGLLKMDFLGLRNLGIITDTLKLIKERYGKSIDIEKVPLENEVFEKIFAQALTNSIFQFESAGMKQMLQQFRPSSIDDIILLVAAYRPGPMQFLDSVIAVKHGRKEPEYVIPEMESVLGTTYGSPIYQEQIMTIFNKFAGFSLGESDIIRRYMSKKKTDKFMAYKDKFVDGMIDRGAERQKVEAFWDQLVEFSKYAFNKSHAAAYAFVAYYTAYLKCYYPVEYLCSVMNHTVLDKLGGLFNDAKSLGIDVTSPNINTSAENFSISNDKIVCGLGLIKNVGRAACDIIEEREKNGNFTSFSDFMIRTKCRKDVAESLVLAGAFDDFTRNRAALVIAISEYSEVVKKITAKKEIIDNEEEKKTKRENAKKALETLYQNLSSISVDYDGEENRQKRLQSEKEMLGAYVSSHPLDSYKKPKELNCTPIDSLVKGRKSIMGIITNLRLTNRKSDGAPMAFFTLEDSSGKIEVNCFTKVFAKFGSLIVEDAVVKISGECIEEENIRVNSESDDGLENEEVILILKFNADSLEVLKEEKPYIIVFVKSVMDWADNVSEKIKPYLDNTGYPIILYDELTGTFRKTKNEILVNKSILDSKNFTCTLK